MRVTGIIAEYDPFHNGHLYHMRQAVKVSDADAVVAVISGAFTQRGMPSFYSRETRARAALSAGADLVLELPYIYACNSAREFAFGGISILHSLGVVTDLAFGSECDRIDLLQKAACIGEEASLVEAEIRRCVKTGMSYPAAVCRAVSMICGDETGALLRQPNNVLGVEYIRALHQLNSSIRPHCITRKGAGHGTDVPDDERVHDGPEGLRMASATAIRRRIAENPDDGIQAVSDYIPRSSAEIFQDQPYFCSDETLYHFLRYKLLSTDAERLREIYSVSEGIEHRLKSAALAAESFDDFMDAVGTKRYTEARIRRMLIHILTDFTAEKYEQLRGVSYARVLGFSEKGGRLLRRIRKESSIEVVSNLSKLDYFHEKTAMALRCEMKAGNLYNLQQQRPIAQFSDRRFIPIRMR